MTSSPAGRHPDVMNDETEALLQSLNDQRDHILEALDGLSDADLRRPALPTGWTCLGLVRHLTYDVEQWWFRGCVAGEPIERMTGDDAWRVPAETPAQEVLGRYREEVARANEIIAATSLDAMPRWWPTEIFPDFPARPLRRTILHVITETATHAGHLDAARELIDGQTWLILT
jgi:uncharacterized damage-inducible protein DinB